ncbi:hypothetical protein ABIA32_000242 [Streptacidiphilus sp. MAP12-20]|uniref:hypothetical protein n=1 Tax=Streptacidiphilus sp. MAP12-20 TaxID=3156299 RepID=UPI00351441A2
MDPDFMSAHEADPTSIPAPDAAVVIRAHNDAARIAPTVLAARALPGIRAVLVLDAGSTDSTRRVATDSGATLLRDEAELAGYAPLPLLFVDAGRQGARLAEARALLTPVAAGEADAAVAVWARRGDAAARLERRGLARAGFETAGVLTGEFCVSSASFAATRPAAAGAGALTGMIIDLLRADQQVTTVVLEAPREPRGRGLRGRREVARALRGRRTVSVIDR